MLLASICLLALIYENSACETSSFKNIRAVLSGRSKENPVDLIVDDCLEKNADTINYFTVEITNQNVERLNRGAFANLTISTLILSNNRISQIDKQAFFNLRSVQNVDLSKNRLKTLVRDVFNDLISVKILDLTKNQIDVIEDEVFAHMVSLQELKLSNNKIKVWNPNWFANNLDMNKLEVDRNLIEILPENSFTDMENLRDLILRDNAIREIHPNAFKRLVTLKSLDLSRNNLVKLHEDTFAPFNGVFDASAGAVDKYKIFGPINPFAGLWDFSIHTNNLTYFSDKMMQDLVNSRSLNSFNFHSNPWQCGCYRKIVKWADSHRLRLNGKGVGCFRKDNPVCVVPKKDPKGCVADIEEDLRSTYFSKFKVPIDDFFDRNVVCNIM